MTPRVVGVRPVSGPSVHGCRGAGANTPLVVVEPRHPRVIVVSYLIGAGVAAVVARSTDGGRHWHRTALRGVTDCTGLASGSLVDPALAMVGRHVVAAESFLGKGGPQDYVFASSDGGRTFSGGHQVESASPEQRVFVAIDPLHPRTVHAEVEYLTDAAGQGLPALRPVSVMQSPDGGHHFSAPVAVDGVGPRFELTAGIVDTGRVIVVLFARVSLSEVGTALLGGTATETLVVARSTDGGRTFTGHRELGSQTFDLPGPIAPGEPTPAGCCIASMAADRDGHVVAAWADGRSGTVQVRRSRDAGLTWRRDVITLHDPVANAAAAPLPGGGAAVFAYERRTGRHGEVFLRPVVTFLTARGGSRTVVIGERFDEARINDGTDDSGPVGPMQGIAYAGAGKVVVAITAARAHRSRHAEVRLVTLRI